MKKYCVKAWDGLMEWNSEYYEFEAMNDEEANQIANDWFNDEYLPEVISDSQSYAEYPEEEDYESEEEYDIAVREAEDELMSSLFWEFIDND